MKIIDLMWAAEKIVERILESGRSDIESVTIDTETDETPAKIFVDFSDDTRSVCCYSERLNAFILAMTVNK